MRASVTRNVICERGFQLRGINSSLPSYNPRLVFHGHSKRISRRSKDFAFARLETFRWVSLKVNPHRA
ncbi:hypothetical protein MPLA_760051 [Mesorhizobium sp. ORS 3359]|nr:hypothetical protein MPLA_760051 [Mesorhizobium sp. ORS 3359]